MEESGCTGGNYSWSILSCLTSHQKVLGNDYSEHVESTYSNFSDLQPMVIRFGFLSASPEAPTTCLEPGDVQMRKRKNSGFVYIMIYIYMWVAQLH